MVTKHTIHKIKFSDGETRVIEQIGPDLFQVHDFTDDGDTTMLRTERREDLQNIAALYTAALALGEPSKPEPGEEPAPLSFVDKDGTEFSVTQDDDCCDDVIKLWCDEVDEDGMLIYTRDLPRLIAALTRMYAEQTSETETTPDHASEDSRTFVFKDDDGDEFEPTDVGFAIRLKVNDASSINFKREDVDRICSILRNAARVTEESA